MRKLILALTSLLVASLLSVSLASAQSLDTSDPLAAHIGIVARATGDSITLRWGPSNAAVWRGASDVGYIIERIEAGRTTALTAQPIKPWPKEQWAAAFQSRDDAALSKDGNIDYLSVAYTLLYDAPNADVALQNGIDNAQELQDKQSSLEMSRSFALMAADRDAIAAEALGLRFVDHNVKPGATYTYRVRLARNLPTYHVSPGSVTIKNDRQAPIRASIRATEGDGRIALAWPRMKEYNMYFVDRSEDGGKSFTRLTKLPQLTVFAGHPSDSEGYGDTNAINYRPYVYRVYGTTSFADIEALGDVRAMAHDVTPPGDPLLYQPKQTGDHAMELKWEMHAPVASDLKAFRIYRGTTDSTTTTAISELLPSAARTFTDTHFSDTVNNYYVIEAIDTARNISRSFAVYAPLIDSIPPSQPAWISGTMDTNGIVTLTLKGNTERDLMGYRLLKANAADHEFSPFYESYANPDDPIAKRAAYNDTVTLRSLTKYVYYKAIALDRNYNESPLSAVIAVPRPDRVAPVAPVITDVTPTDTNVWIIFVPSSSDDVKNQLLLRREEGQREWKTAADAKASSIMIADYQVTANTVYEYAMQAIDSSGNRSKLSGIVTARPYASSTIPAVHDLKAALRDDQKAITLSWANPDRASRVILYRGVGDNPVQQYTQLTDDTRFLDKNVTKGVRYTYAVKAFATNGAESQLSNRVTIEVR